MNRHRVELAVIVLLSALIVAGCGDDKIPNISDPTGKTEATPKPPLELIDISRVPHLDPKGRFQEGRTALGEPNPVAKELVANGKDSIPFLIGKLDDETEMDRTIMNYWYQLHVGDMALIILTDFFTDESETRSTIPGFSWDEFLERGGDRSITGEQVLRRYIERHGRKEIQRRWQEMWEKNKEKISWDQKCRCFKMY